MTRDQIETVLRAFDANTHIPAMQVGGVYVRIDELCRLVLVGLDYESRLAKALGERAPYDEERADR